MKVKLIQMTQNPIDVMLTASRTCYSEKSPIEIWEDRYGTALDDCEHTQKWIEQLTEKHWKLVKKVLDSGHQSVAEHVYFTFAIEGISRACSHQLVRHRHCTFSQQSQRYVGLERGNFDFVYPENVTENNEIVKKFDKTIESISQCYDEMMVTYGIKAEDARSLLPNATKTNITMSVNFRELMHICNLRLCTRAQSEIRDLFKEIVECVKHEDERLASYLVPQCEVLGFCKEDKCCGRKPKLNDILIKGE